MKKSSHFISRVHTKTPSRSGEAQGGTALNTTARLLAKAAKRWQQRALFYERYRDYFPHLSKGRFVGRCHEVVGLHLPVADVRDLSDGARQVLLKGAA